MINKKVEVTDKIILDFTKINRFTGEITVRISTEHGNPSVIIKKFKEGDSYTYTLKVQEETIA